MANTPFIAIEGPIGVGKTSLAEKLSAQFRLHLLKEIVDENPFLSKFYEDRDDWSFQTEMFFLCNRYKQLEDIKAYFTAQSPGIIADYHIYKNMIFAKRTLSPEQLSKYKQIFDILTKDLTFPNIMIYLHASLDTLEARIRQRGRDMEKNIESSYLARLIQDYDDYINEFEYLYPNIPVIRIDGDNNDFINYQRDLDSIISHLDRYMADF